MEDPRTASGLGATPRIHRTVSPSGQDGLLARGRYSAFGVSWEMRADDVSAYHLLLDRLPAVSTPTSGRAMARTYVFRTLPSMVADGDVSFMLAADDRPLVRSSESEVVADAFEDDLKFLLAERSPRKVFLRAGVVGWRDRAIVIPGGPHSGKSTLVRALVGCGATYYSDEYAVIEGNTVQPFPARSANWTLPGTALSYWMDELGKNSEPKPLPIGLILFAPYQAGAVFKPKLLPRGQSLLGMFKHAVASQRNPERVLRALEVVSRRCNGLEGVRGDAHTAASYLIDRLV
jgi:hypothetical protein